MSKKTRVVRKATKKAKKARKATKKAKKAMKKARNADRKLDTSSLSPFSTYDQQYTRGSPIAVKDDMDFAHDQGWQAAAIFRVLF
jgi:hypothetical protein